MLTLFGIALLAGGVPVIIANLIPPSPIFGEEPALALCRIGFGAVVSSSGLLVLA